MERRQKINIRISNVELPMIVHSADEEKRYRDASSYINDRLMSVRQKYSQIQEERYFMAIVMLELATRGMDMSTNSAIAPYKQSISELQSEIDSLLSEASSE